MNHRIRSLASDSKIRAISRWLPTYVRQRSSRRLPDVRPAHLIIGLADHFEPMSRVGTSGKVVDFHEQERRLENWCRKYPAAVGAWRDDDGYPLRHTYFYPAEEYDEALIDRLAEHCAAGWGEIEIHLHHGVEAPDSREKTTRALVEFRDALASRGCLARENDAGSPQYAFVHGNWALANSENGRFCGVDDEMQILANTGCYADFTLPAPTCAQVSKINALYECALPLDQAAPHRRGNDLECGRAPRIFPLIIQGPLLIDFGRRKQGWRMPGIENSELTERNPPTMHRMRLWRKANIVVRGRPDWIFIKLHCHGLNPRDEPAMLGASIQRFLRELVDGQGNRNEYRLHFVTAREMVNIIRAACDGRTGNPGEFRDYRLRLIRTSRA